ncbi:MAG: TonB-dependent receptor domain-containing protein, partial [Blastocatellia bacterium]
MIPTLLPGKYTIAVEAPNFKKAVFTDVEVRLGQVTVIDVGMQAGGASETVTVTANTETVIQKDTSQVSTSFQSRAVEDLPSNVAGVGIDTLALLAPGVTPGFGNVNGNGTTLSVNGNRARSNNFTIDGVDNNDLSIGGPSYFVDNQDQVAEFQVVTNNFSAQYGRNQGAIVNIVTKSGTNSFHGSAFEFHRDASNLDSLNNIEKSGGQTGPLPLLYNVFGGTIGGPIIKDKAFFFGSYQGITTRQAAADITGGVAILASDLPKLAADFPNNAAIQAYSKFSYFAITADGTATVRAGFPVETVTIGGHTYQAAVPQKDVIATALTPYSEQEFSGRGDVKVSEKNNVWGRYLFQNPDFKNGLAFGNNGYFGDEPAKSQSAAGTWDRQISAISFNEFSFSYSRLAVLFGGGCTATTPGCTPDPTQIDQAFTNFSGLGGIRGSITGLGLLGIGPATNLPQGRIVQAFQFRDNYSRTMGRHQFQMGADIRRLKNEVPFLPTVNGNFNFGNNGTRFATNDPSSTTLAAGTSTLSYSETDQFYYFQDDWKIRDNLTLNLGIRYEFTGQPINLLADLTQKREANPATALWLQSLPLSARTVPRIPNDKNNFAPRFGFAYTPRFWKKLFGDDATVIRGGYSVAYDASFYNILLNVSTSTPVVFNNVTLNPAPPAAAIFPVPTGAAFGPAVRAFATANKIFATNLFDPRFFTQTQVSNNFRSPYAEQWSLGIQRQITKNDVFEVRYLGTHGVGLFQQSITNPQFATLLN